MIQIPEVSPEQEAEVKRLRAQVAPGYNFLGNYTIHSLDPDVPHAAQAIASLRRRYGGENVLVSDFTLNRAGGYVPNALAVYLKEGAQPRSFTQRVISRFAHR